MKTLNCLLLMLLVGLASPTYSQVKPTDVRSKLNTLTEQTTRFCATAKSEIDTSAAKTTVATSETYRKYIESYFTYLAYERGTLPTGTSASLELSNNSTQLKLSLAKKFANSSNGSMLIATGGVQAKMEDGVSNLFNGNIPSSGTSFFGNIAFMPRHLKRKPIRYIVSEFENGEMTSSPYDTYNQKRIDYQEYFCSKNNENLRKYEKMLCRWEELKKLLGNPCAEGDVACCKQMIDAHKEKEEIEKELDAAGLTGKSAAKISAALEKQYRDKMYEIETENDTWEWVRFQWITAGATYTREKYDTYNGALALAKQFGTKDFDALGARITMHWFKEKFENISFGGSSYFNLSYALNRSNSFASIKIQDIIRNIQAPSNPPDTVVIMQLSKKAKNITSKDFETTWLHNFSSNYTIMLGKKQSVGFNGRLETELSELSAPVYNGHLGVLVRMNNNNHDPEDKKSKAKVNFELFFEFPDISDTGESGKSVWQNKQVGINVSLPFNKIFFD